MLKNKCNKKCKECGKIFLVYKYRLKTNRGQFCSVLCHNKFQKGKKPWNTGKKCKSLSESKKGYKNPMWKGGISKKESDSKYAKTKNGKISKKKSQIKYYSKEENKEKRRNWTKEKIKKDVHFKIKRNISNQIWCKLNRNRGCKKDRKVTDCLPYTIEELKNHIEKLFLPKMNWNNYGKWHIDHKIPDSSFIYSSTKDEEFQKSWALKNLQPLWAIDNLVKGNRY